MLCGRRTNAHALHPRSPYRRGVRLAAANSTVYNAAAMVVRAIAAAAAAAAAARAASCGHGCDGSCRGRIDATAGGGEWLAHATDDAPKRMQGVRYCRLRHRAPLQLHARAHERRDNRPSRKHLHVFASCACEHVKCHIGAERGPRRGVDNASDSGELSRVDHEPRRVEKRAKCRHLGAAECPRIEVCRISDEKQEVVVRLVVAELVSEDDACCKVERCLCGELCRRVTLAQARIHARDETAEIGDRKHERLGLDAGGPRQVLHLRVGGDGCDELTHALLHARHGLLVRVLPTLHDGQAQHRVDDD
mmetsp:Transcript_20857/g.53802  ORF Transcript_20857/g.53802 Transcript_20857/m.53802 type:complete len:306 (-) Transcript_20857:39-956(-)